MSKNLDHDDLGIDLDRTASLPECNACRKKSDGAKKCDDGTILCGTHFDEYLSTLFPKSPDFKRHESPDEFAKRLAATTYKACWDAKLD